MPSTERGHQALPHVADVICEAWAPDFTACYEEAVAALVAICFDPAGAEVRGRHLFSVPSGPPESMLLGVLDEMLYVFDTTDAVPTGADVVAGEHGLDVAIQLADRAAVEVVGPAPKAISRSELTVARDGDVVRCRFLVDV